MPAPYIFASSGAEPPYDYIDVTPTSGDVDLSDPDGPTAGICARGLYIVSASAGNVVFLAVGSPVGNGGAAPTPANRTVAASGGVTLSGFVTKIVDSGTTVDQVFALI